MQQPAHKQQWVRTQPPHPDPLPVVFQLMPARTTTEARLGRSRSTRSVENNVDASIDLLCVLLDVQLSYKQRSTQL